MMGALGDPRNGHCPSLWKKPIGPSGLNKSATVVDQLSGLGYVEAKLCGRCGHED